MTRQPPIAPRSWASGRHADSSAAGLLLRVLTLLFVLFLAWPDIPAHAMEIPGARNCAGDAPTGKRPADAKPSGRT